MRNDRSDRMQRPIGIFDSGIGGLTVLHEIHKRLPDENTIYLGDTARVPYGIRSPETVIRYALESARFLVSRNIKVLVVACNSASAVSIDILRNAFSLPIIGVIEPGAKAAVATTRIKRIGIIGTEATIRSQAYENAIRKEDRSIEVYSHACPLFVPLVEEGWSGPVVELAADAYLKDIRHKGIDTLVLGCTHYPLLKQVISRIVGEEIILIDSAVETTKQLTAVLQERSLSTTTVGTGIHEYFVTDSPDRFVEVGERFLGGRIHDIKKTELEMEV